MESHNTCPFRVWFLSLRVRFPRFVRGVTQISTPSHFVAESYSTVCMNVFISRVTGFEGSGLLGPGREVGYRDVEGGEARSAP